VSVYILVGLFGLLALICVLIGWMLLRRKSWLFQWLKGTTGLFSILIAIFLGIAGYELSRFQLIPDDELPSLLKASISEKSKHSFIVSLTSLDPTHKEYLLKGDLWEVVVRVWVWSPVLDVLQLPDLYKVENVSSRYLSIEQEIKEGATIEILYKPSLNIWPILEFFSTFGMYQTESIESVFLPAADGSLFSINLVDGQLALEAVNAPAKAVLKNW